MALWCIKIKFKFIQIKKPTMFTFRHTTIHIFAFAAGSGILYRAYHFGIIMVVTSSFVIFKGLYVAYHEDELWFVCPIWGGVTGFMTSFHSIDYKMPSSQFSYPCTYMKAYVNNKGDWPFIQIWYLLFVWSVSCYAILWGGGGGVCLIINAIFQLI